VVDPLRTHVVYVGSWTSGVYLSEDAGETWNLLNDGLRTRSVRKLAISSDGETLYAATRGEGVFRLSTLSQDEFDALTPGEPFEAIGLTPGETSDDMGLEESSSIADEAIGTVSVSIACDCSEQVKIKENVSLEFGWSTAELEQAEQFLEIAHLQVSIDGEDIGVTDEFWVGEVRGPEGGVFPYSAWWEYVIWAGNFSVGQHRIDATLILDDVHFDGDAEYGPGEVLSTWLEIEVTE